MSTIINALILLFILLFLQQKIFDLSIREPAGETPNAIEINETFEHIFGNS